MAIDPLILNGHPVVIQLSIGTEANITEIHETGNTKGFEGEIAFSSDTRKLFIFPSTGGDPIGVFSGALVCHENDVLCYENEALYY